MLSLAGDNTNDNNRNKLCKRLAICLLVNVALLTSTTIRTTTCFSTQRSDRNVKQAAVASAMRSAGARRDTSNGASNSYTVNYITAIEDSYNCVRPLVGSGSSGASDAQQAFFVATTDHNYAIYSPCLLDRGWRSVTVNGDQVFVLKDDNRVFSTSLYNLNELQRDLIAEVRSNFTQSLAGLKFSRYTSGSSAQLPTAQHGGGGPAFGSSNGCTGPTAAANAFGRLLSNSNNNSHQTAPIGLDNNKNRVVTSSHAHSSRQANNNKTPPAANSGTTHCAMSQSKSVCSPSRLQAGDTFNYYNLYNARLNTTIAGDIYFMDFHCNILDIYSSTVSVRQLTDTSVLYRDPNYFSLSRSNLPLAINRFFIVSEQVFFVYNDGSVLVKPKWQLDKTELDTVMHARNWLAASARWQDKVANLGGRRVEIRY